MNKQDALLVALNALQAIDDEHPYPIAKHAIVQISRVLAKTEPWDTSDMAHRSGGLTVDVTDLIERAKAEEREAIKRPWVGLTDEEIVEILDFENPTIRKFAYTIEAKLRERNT
jgi:hypothetical protein